ncbi:MAG: hypothetical protein KC464_03600, partial [Myxococcales bacterium]|nr:hypothetical protein [Myxococcales bacterium]
MSRWLHAVVSVALCLALAACPRGKRHTLVPSVPTSGDPVARARFIEARDAFLRDGSGRADLEEIVRDFPDDPVTPFALLYAGIAAFGDGDAQAAVTELRQIATLDTVDAGLQARADLYLGLSYNALGDSAKALPYLLRSERAVEGDAERGLWIAATAVASAASPTPLDALVWLDRFWDVGTEPERGWVLARLDELV